MRILHTGYCQIAKQRVWKTVFSIYFSVYYSPLYSNINFIDSVRLDESVRILLILNKVTSFLNIYHFKLLKALDKSNSNITRIFWKSFRCKLTFYVTFSVKINVHLFSNLHQFVFVYIVEMMTSCMTGWFQNSLLFRAVFETQVSLS